MAESQNVTLVTLLGALIVFLAWIGWRYFLAPLTPCDRETGTRRDEPPRPPAARRYRLWRRVPSRGYGALAAIVLVGGIVVGGVFTASESVRPDTLAAPLLDRQTHIQFALNPERLVAPPALPPSAFSASARPDLERADRDWNKLNPRFAQKVLEIIAGLQARGYAFALLEGYRSPERQDSLADLGHQVTLARAFQSKHQFGMAVDVAPLRDGQLIISESDPWAIAAYQALGRAAESAGLSWGGRWRLRDYGHIEMGDAGTAFAQPSR